MSAGAAELAALAEGRTPDGPALGLRDAATPEDADAFRERYRQTARTCRACVSGSRGWCSSAPDGPPRRGARARGRRASRGAGPFDAGPIRRAEQWTETLQVYAHEVQMALAARERALAPAADEVVAQAETAVLRETLVTDSVSSGAASTSRSTSAFSTRRSSTGHPHRGGQRLLRAGEQARAAAGEQHRQRLALTFGLTVTNMRREEETRWENLLGEKSNLFVGLGYRLTRSLRLGGGFVLSRRTTRTPSSTSAAWRSALRLPVVRHRPRRRLQGW